MARRYRFRQVDVFTDRPLAGNPLAVFPEAEGLSDAEMQALAREMNLSETTFVLPPSDGGALEGATYRMRIFTPGIELPFAGHPSIGTAWVLADERRFPLTAPRTEVRQEVGIGVLPLAIEVREGAAGGAGEPPELSVGEVTMTQGAPRVLEAIRPTDLVDLCTALELDAHALGWAEADGRSWDVAGAAPTVVTTGLPYLVVPMRDRAALAAIPTERAWAVAQVARRYGCDSAALVALGTSGAVADADVHVRVLIDPATGIVEDPATGSAAGPIAVYLGLLRGARWARQRLVLEQGVEIGRPSRLVAEVDFEADGSPLEVRVSGGVVPVAEGWVTLP